MNKHVMTVLCTLVVLAPFPDKQAQAQGVYGTLDRCLKEGEGTYSEWYADARNDFIKADDNLYEAYKGRLREGIVVTGAAGVAKIRKGIPLTPADVAAVSGAAFTLNTYYLGEWYFLAKRWWDDRKNMRRWKEDWDDWCYSTHTN